MKTIDIFNNMSISEIKNNDFEKFKSESGIELISSLIKKKIAYSVVIDENNNWIVDNFLGKKMIAGQFNSGSLPELFSKLSLEDQDSIMLMFVLILDKMPISERMTFRNFIIDLIR